MKRVYFPIIGIVAAFVVMTIGGVDDIARGQSSLPAPTGVNTANGSSIGEADLSWPEVQGATYYRIGWMADEDYQRARSEPNGEWQKEFRYSNIINRGQSSHTVTRLTPGIKYWFIVGSHNAFYGGPAWSPWAELTVDGDGGSTMCPSSGQCPTIESSQLRMSEVKYKAVDAGKNHTCGIKMDNTIECWGDNTEGQTDAPEGEFMSISAGGVASCGINMDDHLVCWGHERLTRPPDGKYSHVSVGDEHVCAVTLAHDNANKIDCWGLPNNEGRTDNKGVFNVGSSDDQPWLSVTSGSDYNCALNAYLGGLHNSRQGAWRLQCWGTNKRNYDAFVREGGLMSVSAGSKHICGLFNNRGIACHGDDVHEQTTGKPKAQDEGSPLDFYTYSVVSAGGSHTCGLRTTGNIRCWGDDLRGQATPPGNNDELQSNLQGVGDFKAITAGDAHTCGLRDDGTAVCWGYNAHGQADPP